MTEHLSPRRLAEAIGVSESSVKRWVDSGLIETRVTAGGHRRIPVAAAIRFARGFGAGPIDPAALGIATRRSSATDAGPVEALYGHLLRGRTREAMALVRTLFLSGRDAARIIDEPFRVAMDRLGQLWHDRGEEGVFLEHRATQIGLEILYDLRALQAPPDASAPLALGGAPDGDPYVLPTLGVATVLESVGFTTSNLGPETPVSAFTSAIDNLRPDVVWLSVTSAHGAFKGRRTINELGEAVARVGGKLILGGQANDRVSHDSPSLSFRGDSMVELAAFARGILQGRSDASAAS